jgi:hypothetical protein
VEIMFMEECAVPVPGAGGITLTVPMHQVFACSDEIGAALIAAGVAVDGAEYVPPPPEFADKVPAPRELPFPLP